MRAQGDLSEAERLAYQTLALSRRVNDAWPEAQALLELGVLARLQGQPIEAQRQLRASIALFRELGELWSVARALNHLGDATYALGHDTEAHRCFLEGLRTALAAQALPVALDTLVGIAVVRARAGLTESAGPPARNSPTASTPSAPSTTVPRWPPPSGPAFRRW